MLSPTAWERVVESLADIFMLELKLLGGMGFGR